MPNLKALTVVMVATLTLLAVAAPPAAAAPRTRAPAGSNYDLCIIDQPNSETSYNSVVQLCCYTNGCWVCPNKTSFSLSECKWFPVAALQPQGGTIGNINPLLQQFDQNLHFTPQQTPGQTPGTIQQTPGIRIAPTAPAQN